VNLAIVYWVFATLSLIAGVYLSYVSFSGGRRDGSAFGYLIINVSAIVLQSAFMILAVGPADLEFWFQIRYTLLLLLPLTWFHFALVYSRQEKKMPPWVNPVLWTLNFIFIIGIWTNPLHQFFFEGLRGRWGEGLLLSFTWKKMGTYWINVVQAYVLLIAGVFLIARISWKSPSAFKGQRIIVMSGGLLYGAVVTLGVLRIIPRMPDWSSVSLLLICFIAYTILIKFRIQQMVPVAHELVFQELADGVIILDRSGNLLDANKTALKWFQIEKEKKLGRALGGKLLAYVNPLLEMGDVSPQLWKPEGENTPQWLSVRLQDLGVEFGSEEGWIIFFQDVSAQQDLVEEVQNLANKDPLTGLFNRSFFFQRAEYHWEVTHRHMRPVSLLSMDLDHFKDINDQGGHGAGDEVLRVCSELIQSFLRISDILARFGGEEFILFLPETKAEDALLLGEKIKEKISKTEFKHQGKSYYLTLSVGVVGFPESDARDLDELVSMGNRALKKAKESGRNKVVLFGHQKVL